MATAIIHGDPGSYKTSSLVSEYLVPAVKQGRVVVTNIRGVKSREEIADIYKFELPDTGEIIQVPFNEIGFSQISRFFHWVPEGAIILMDEGQRVYPTRLRNFSEFDLINPSDDRRPRTVEDAFDSHRHMNWDIYISTPNIGKIHKEIRAVAEFGYRHKNMATVFSFMKGRYKRVAHNAENSGASVGNTISATIRKIDARCFNVYESTATGQTKDSQAGFSFFLQPKVLLLLCVIGYSVWNMGSNLYAAGGLPVIFGGSAKFAAGASSATPVPVRPQALSAVPAGAVSARDGLANPFSGVTIYHTGQINGAFLFELVYPDHSHLQLSQMDVQQIGFSIDVISRSVLKLTFGSESMFVLPKPQPAYVPPGTEAGRPIALDTGFAGL